MSKFIVEGGHKLGGEIKIQGSKNAAFPVIAAAILTDKTCVIENVPDILDVRNFLEILRYLGARFVFADHRLEINARYLKNRPLLRVLTSKLRGSIALVGPMLAKFGDVRFVFPGGDAIGRRPIDVHLDGFRKLGAKISHGGEFIRIKAQGKLLRGGRMVLAIPSVTGTQNLILAAALAKGVSQIRLAAAEPQVQRLCSFLQAMGLKIRGAGTPSLQIKGREKLAGAKFTLGSDEIETVTFLIAAAATKGEVLVKAVEPEYLDAPLATLERMNINLEVGSRKSGRSWIHLKQKANSRVEASRIITGVFPQLLTDDQPLFGVLATQAVGQTLIHDWIYEGRQGYLKILEKMGAKVQFEDVHRASIFGPTKLSGTEIKTPDIRAGASILIAALVAKGRSVIYNAEIIDRGYERLDERLNSLGARIERVE